MTQAVRNDRHRNNSGQGISRRELRAIRSNKLSSQALELQKAIEECHDAGLISLRSGNGVIPPKGSTSDPTGNSMTAYEYRRLKDAQGFAQGKIVKARKAIGAAQSALEEALVALHDAWLDTDPDLGPDRRAKRRAAREAAERVAQGRIAG